MKKLTVLLVDHPVGSRFLARVSPSRVQLPPGIPAPMKITFRVHAIQRMFERAISPRDVRRVLERGETIEDYPEGGLYPSRLLLGRRGKRPIHIVAAYNTAADEAIIVTDYEPGPARWDADFRKRQVR